MFKILFRVSGWFTLFSLVFWGGVLAYMITAQPVQQPKPQFYATYDDCVGRYAASVPYRQVHDEVVKYCTTYYALLGDRSVPVLDRLYQRSVGSIIDDLIVAYMTEHAPPAGVVVDGKTIYEKIGTSRVLGFALDAVLDSGKVTPADRLNNAACFLENAHAARSMYQLQMLPLRCPRLPQVEWPPKEQG